MGRLVRIGGEEPPTLETTFKRDVDGRPRWLESAAATCRLSKRSGYLGTVLVEDQDIGGERISRVENPTGPRALLVAVARQAVPRFEHDDLKLLPVAKKRDAGR